MPLAAVGNYLLFFGPTLWSTVRGFVREGGRARQRHRMRFGVHDGRKRAVRRCAICSVGDDDSAVDIRVCSCEKCGGKNRDLCLMHARDH